MSLFAANYLSGESNRIKKSVDDGDNFSDLSDHSAVALPMGIISSADEQKMMVCGYHASSLVGRVSRTLNGGAYWAEILETLRYCRAIARSPTDINKVWVSDLPSGDVAAKIHYSTDFGVTWTGVELPESNRFGVFGISFISDLVGWCAGVYSNDVKVWKTIDGGVSWSRQLTVEEDSGISTCDLVAVNADVVYMVQGGPAGGIWKTTNGGTDWSGTATPRAYSASYLAVSGNTVAFADNSGTTIEIIYSQDAGASWTRTTVTDDYASTNIKGVPIVMESENVGYLFGYSCFRTADGCQTWSKKGVCAQSTSQTPYSALSNPNLDTQFRTFDITGSEPSNRTSEGSEVTSLNKLNFGDLAVGQDSDVKVVIFRANNLGAYSAISNMRFWLSSKSGFVGTNTYHADITDTWTTDKTPAQVKAGTPGTCPETEPSANLTKNGGGNIDGVGHADTSQYIYLVNDIGLDESLGEKTLDYKVKFDFS